MIAKRSEAPQERYCPASCHHRHTVYGLTLASDFPLTSVAEATEGGEVAICVELRPSSYFRQRVQGAPESPDDWIWHTVLDDGSIHIWVRKVFETIVSADGRRIACLKLEDADPQAFEANLMNFGLSTALTLQGEEPLHATVVDFGDRSVALLGPSGAGKSTLAAVLVAQGAGLVTDDMLRLTFVDDRALAYPGPYRLKLFDEPARRFLPGAAEHGHFNALSGKLLVQPRRAAPAPDAPRPLSALCWIAAPREGDEVSVARLEGAALAKVLIASAMNIRYFAPQRLARQLRFAEQIGRRLPVYELSYPRDYSVMGRVADELRRLSGA